MRPLGSVLMAAGIAVGALVGLGLMAGVTIPGVPWLIAVGLVKLTLLASVGLMRGAPPFTAWQSEARTARNATCKFGQADPSLALSLGMTRTRSCADR